MKIPNHVAVIQDGNRRFAYKNAIPVEEGHAMGAEKSMDVVEWLVKSGVHVITLYVFSTENFKRSQYEVNSLGVLFLDTLNNIANDARIHDNKINIRIIGDRNLIKERFSEELLDSIDEIESITKDYDRYSLRLAIAYGGRHEIETNLNEAINDTPVDIIMRTAGDNRTSNFLTVQSNGHGALFYKNCKLFPEIKKHDVKKMLKFYDFWTV